MTEWIAEVGNSHNGDIGRACRVIEAAKRAGASAIKLQCYTPDELVELRGDGPAPGPWGEQGYTMRSLYEKARTPHEWFPVLVDYCNRQHIRWFSSVFGPESLALLEKLGCPRYKLAALDEGAPGLYEMVRATGKPIIRSTNNLDAEAAHTWLQLLCPPGYPQPRAYLQLLAYGNFDGYSYHGTDYRVPAMAAVMGADIVEVHFQLRDEPCELESSVSLDEVQFAAMIHLAADVEAML